MLTLPPPHQVLDALAYESDCTNERNDQRSRCLQRGSRDLGRAVDHGSDLRSGHLDVFRRFTLIPAVMCPGCTLARLASMFELWSGSRSPSRRSSASVGLAGMSS